MESKKPTLQFSPSQKQFDTEELNQEISEFSKVANLIRNAIADGQQFYSKKTPIKSPPFKNQAKLNIPNEIEFEWAGQIPSESQDKEQTQIDSATKSSNSSQCNKSLANLVATSPKDIIIGDVVDTSNINEEQEIYFAQIQENIQNTDNSDSQDEVKDNESKISIQEVEANLKQFNEDYELIGKRIQREEQQTPELDLSVNNDNSNECIEISNTKKIKIEDKSIDIINIQSDTYIITQTQNVIIPDNFQELRSNYHEEI